MPTLTNIGTAYDAIPLSQDLGVLAIDFDGAGRLDMAIVWNPTAVPAAAGVLWQVWNEDAQSEVGMLQMNGALAAGRRVTRHVFDVSAAGLAGLVVCRLRVRGVVGSEDLVYYGATFRARRA